MEHGPRARDAQKKPCGCNRCVENNITKEVSKRTIYRHKRLYGWHVPPQPDPDAVLPLRPPTPHDSAEPTLETVEMDEFGEQNWGGGAVGDDDGRGISPIPSSSPFPSEPAGENLLDMAIPAL